jgi:hypothetical protein
VPTRFVMPPRISGPSNLRNSKQKGPKTDRLIFDPSILIVHTRYTEKLTLCI